MFDPLKPNNQLPLLPTSYNYDNIGILKLVNLANIALAKVNALATKLPESMLLISPLLVRESVASSEIENINTTVFKVFEAEILPERQQKGAAKEVLSYRKAMLKGFELIKKRGFLSTNDFVAIQSTVEPNKTGIRKLGVKVANQTTKEVLYTPPEGEGNIRDLLANLEKFINNHEDEIDPLIKAAVFHYQFESIHPFLDGNGRVGRILMVLYLIMTERMDLPVLFISGYINKNKSQYYGVLRQTNATNDFTDIIMFILKAIETQANVTAETISSIEKLMKEFTKTLKEKTNFYKHELIELLFSQPFITIDFLQKGLNLSARQTASKYLSEMVKIGLFEAKKVGKYKFFYSKKFIELLS